MFSTSKYKAVIEKTWRTATASKHIVVVLTFMRTIYRDGSPNRVRNLVGNV